MTGITVAADRLSVEMSREIAAAERAVFEGIDRTAKRIKTSWRQEVQQALGSRLGNAIRSRTYPERGGSMDAAALVYARPGKGKRGGAAQIILGHEEGSLIRSRDGFWLTIPTEEAGKGPRGKSMTPGEWEKRHGTRLQFVYRARGPSLLVAPVKMTKSGRLGKGRMTKTGAYASGTFTSVIFLMVPKVKLRKKLNLRQTAERLAAEAPLNIVRAWRRKD